MPEIDRKEAWQINTGKWAREFISLFPSETMDAKDIIKILFLMPETDFNSIKDFFLNQDSSPFSLKTQNHSQLTRRLNVKKG